MNQILEEYQNYMRKAECPSSYNDWVLLSAISAVAGKKVWLPLNYFNTFPNLYTILISPPGVGKKSTAIRMGRDTIILSGAPVKFCQDNTTSQALMNELVDSFRVFMHSENKGYSSSPLTATASELVTLLSQGPPMVEFLTDIYDADRKFEYKTKNKGSLVIENPCLNLIAGATTDTFCTRIIKDAIAGGFISRSIIVYDNDVKITSPFDLPDKSQEASQQIVADRLAEIATIYGEVKASSEARQLFETWYFEETKRARASGANIEFHSRKHVHVLKVAMLLSLTELSRTISVDTMKIAIDLMAKIEHNMKFIYMSAGANKQSEVHLKILNALYNVEKVEYKDLLAAFMKDCTEQELNDVLATLEKVKYVTQIFEGTKHYVKITDKAREILSTRK